MGLKIFVSTQKLVSTNRNLRMDYRLLEYADKEIPFRFLPFGNFITDISNGKDIGKEDYVDFDKSDIIYPTVNNFKNGELLLDSVTFIDEDCLNSNSKTLQSDDIIISRSGTVGITYIWNEKRTNKLFGRDIYAIPSGYLIVVRIDKEKLLPKFIRHYFHSELMKQYFSVFAVGKSQKNIAQPEILSIPIPDISTDKQKDILDLISPLEAEIEILKSKVKADYKIINEVFLERFKWDFRTFDNLKGVKLLNRALTNFANNIDVRFSYKFHNKAGEYVTQILRSQTSKSIKDFLAENITLGKSISPSDYDESGEQYYISMADIKNWRFDRDDAKTVSHSYFDSNPNKRILLNDIILARSGEGTIGKVAIIENEDTEGVYADFTMRIRMQNYNPLFAYYYFRTDFFQYLIYTHKKGLGNNTNIFPSQLQEFPIPDISLSEQENIVKIIKTQTNKQKELYCQIEDKLKKINCIIESAIA